MLKSKSLSQRTRRQNDDDSILPLINVVFLLLIFFMIAGRLSASDLFPIKPPSSDSETQAAAPQLEILIGPEGQLALDDVLVDQAALSAGVKERLGAAEGVRIHLKADSTAEALTVVAILELLRDAGVEKLNLLTVQQDSVQESP